MPSDYSPDSSLVENTDKNLYLSRQLVFGVSDEEAVRHRVSYDSDPHTLPPPYCTCLGDVPTFLNDVELL